MLSSSHSLGPVLETLLHRRLLLQLLEPSPVVRHRGLALLLKALLHDIRHKPVPWHEHEVCEAQLLAHKVRLASVLEMGIDDTQNTLDLVAVAVNDRREVLLGVVHQEPSALAEVGALARHLEVRPALLLVFLWEFGVAEAVGLVVGLEKILDDGAGLECESVSAASGLVTSSRTSHNLMPVFGSSIAGTRPFGLMDSNGSFLRSPKSMILVS